MAFEDRGESSDGFHEPILLDAPELSAMVNLTEGPAFDTRMVEMVQALTGCHAGDAEYALECTTQLQDGDPMAWCSRAIVRLKNIGLA